MLIKNVVELLESDHILQEYKVNGWVRAFRSNRFIALNDGSCLDNLQCIVDFENTDEEVLKSITTGAPVSVIGTLKESEGKGQRVELDVKSIEILGKADP
ncbi:asparagine--tRNA ligase, partial [Aquimarina celericrescens]|nr:asparagine--tRNA ligase [Aquimarina celericrescens]